MAEGKWGMSRGEVAEEQETQGVARAIHEDPEKQLEEDGYQCQGQWQGCSGENRATASGSPGVSGFWRASLTRGQWAILRSGQADWKFYL